MNKGTRFIATVLLARTLNLGDFGLLNVGIAISGVLITLTALGLPEYGAREVAVAPSRAREVAGVVVYTRLGALALLSAVTVAATAIFVPHQANVVALAVLMTLGLSGSTDWLLRGRERMADVAGATALGGVVVLVGSATIVMLVPTTTVALIVFALGEAAACFATWLRARVGRPQLPSIGEVRRILRRSWPLGASGLIIYASYTNLDSIVLAAVRSDAEAGLYSAPYRLFLAANAVTLFAAYSLLPMLARRHHEGRPAERRRLLLRSFLPLSGYGVLVLGLSELLAKPVLTTLFGDEFSDTRSVLIILCVAMPLYSIGYPAGYGLIGEQRNWHFFVGGAVAGGLNLLLMALLIPAYGIDGAAIATTAALVAGGFAWLLLADAVRPALGLNVALAAISLLGVLAARSTALSVPIGLATAAAGSAMLLAPLLHRGSTAHR